nr:RES domain-containing protein [uncultured Draconibacterium sp.]
MNYNELLKYIENYSKNKNVNSYDSLKKTIYQCQFPFPTISISEGTNLFRARIHKKGEKYFDKIDDIANIKDLEGIKYYGRANERKQSIFYCSDDQITAAFEVSHISRKNERPKIEIITIGVWEVKEELRLGVVPIHAKIKGVNRIANKIYENYQELNINFKKDGIDIPINLLNFISDEFVSNANEMESNYLISCAFANYMFDSTGYDSYYKRDISLDGILYTSVQYEREGMNLALKDEVVNNSKIELVKAFRRTSIKTKKDTYQDEIPKLAKLIDRENGKIIWE